MKSIGFGLICLLGCTTLAWAQDGLDEAEPLPIFLITYTNTDKSLALSASVKLSWFEAQAACAAKGYQLMSLETPDEEDKLFKFLLESGRLSSLNEPLWTAGTNLEGATSWKWFNSGEIFSYDNFATRPSGTNRCVGFNGNTNKWIAEACTTKRYFVCQKVTCTA